ncbi:ATP-dependent RecD-like DNA helicase [Verrucomicrobium sp. 3C]|uniref:ATP-dependent DNA helicase n=1 Tax=Verrucomicrobium sp. 3C TaxID=1134055 RepID=UPI000373050D|nr:DEAD/DEAH box helicase [Verrucomicrobium sp. 3C]
MIFLCDTKASALAAIERFPVVLLTGGAGTGKSVLVRRMGERGWILCASTGLAAWNIGGKTVHSFFGIKPSSGNPGLREELDRAPGIVIDEVSMLDAESLDAINGACQDALETTEPFGGKQVLLVGDFLQLPPVKGKWSFLSHAWQEADPPLVALTTPRRHADDRFWMALQRLRWGKVSPAAEKLLASSSAKCSGTETPVILVARRKAADQINAWMVSQLTGERCSYESSEGEGPDGEGGLELAVGAKVMVTVNLPDLGLANGSIGFVRRLGSRWVDVEMGGVVKRIGRIQQGNGLNRRTWIPLRLAWSVTIHRAQGLTLDEALVDLDGVFAPGQAYVALSRVRDPNRMTVRNWSRSCVRADPVAVEWLKRKAAASLTIEPNSA